MNPEVTDVMFRPVYKLNFNFYLTSAVAVHAERAIFVLGSVLTLTPEGA